MGTERLGEFALIEAIRARASSHPLVRVGIGDDCAVLAAPEADDLLVTTDMLMDGRHFRLQECGPRAVGIKAMGVNLSDIAAMAGVPVAAFVAVALPRGSAREIAPGLREGLEEMARLHGVALAGGDTNAWDGPLVVCVTVLGTAPRGRAVLRSGARPGDHVFVTGALGGSILGRHLAPVPRIREAVALRAFAEPRAMIDLSDGLASDLGHILEESGGLGATLDATSIPIHADALELANRDGRSPLVHALTDGEDFELCFAVTPEDSLRLRASPPSGTRLALVGVVESTPGMRIRDEGGAVHAVTVRGFDHLAGS